jgi:hypothetical protein
MIKGRLFGFTFLALALEKKGAPVMESTKYAGMDVHKEAITIAVMNSAGKLIMESIIEAKAITTLQFIQGNPRCLGRAWLTSLEWQSRTPVAERISWGREPDPEKSDQGSTAAFGR